MSYLNNEENGWLEYKKNNHEIKMNKNVFYWNNKMMSSILSFNLGDHPGSNRMVGEFTTTCAISAYHH